MDEPALRVATLADAEAIDALMTTSAEALFPRFYDERQAASAVRFVASLDEQLLADGTYFVLEADGEPVGCGGWSRRDRLYTGSGEAQDDARLLDPATEAARVRAMFVRADWTREGLGRRILEACEAAARAEGFTRARARWRPCPACRSTSRTASASSRTSRSSCRTASRSRAGRWRCRSRATRSGLRCF